MAEPFSRVWEALPVSLFAHDGPTTGMGGSDPVRCVPFILCAILTMTAFGFDDRPRRDSILLTNVFKTTYFHMISLTLQVMMEPRTSTMLSRTRRW